MFKYSASKNKAGLNSLRAKIKFIMMILVIALSLIGMNPTSALAAGATYYVNKTNGSCSDAGSGTTIGIPFCTIQKGASVALAGDTVQVIAGSYAETVAPTHVGSLGLPITFSAAPGVIVTGNGTSTGSAFRLTGPSSYITIDGFTINGTAETGIYVTGSNIIISNNHVSATASDGIYAVDSSSVTISNNQVSSVGRYGIYLKTVSASTVSGNTSDHNLDGIRLSASTGVTVSDNITFANIDLSDPLHPKGNGIALLAASTANTLLHNIAYANRDTGLQIELSSNNFVLGNLSYHNGDHGIDNTDHSLNQMIVGNTIQGNHTSGINLELSSTGSTITNNIVADNGLAPIEGRKAYNIYADDTSYTGTTLNYNLYYLSPSYTTQIKWNTTGYTTLAAFQAATIGLEDNGLEGNPLFVAPAAYVPDPYAVSVVTGDYHLNPTSPAIDSANSSAPSEPSTDIQGHPRMDDPSTANTGAGIRAYDDRGAYEFQPGTAYVTTQAVGAIGQTAATGNGTIVSLGLTNPTQHGVVWDTAIDPTIALSTKTTDGSVSATGAFASAITGLNPGTLYHVRAYATNSVGTAYGNDVTFTTATGTPAATYNSGSGTWVAPVGVTSVIVEVWGGGGKGGTRTSNGNGGGGGGGGYSRSILAVTPGNSYPYVVGAGSTTSAAGGNSSFNTSSVVANGGNSVADNSATGASGGAAGVGSFTYSGGAGASGASNYGGGGGSSAGTGANGTTATVAAGATAPAGGGNGGSGSTNQGNGTNGAAPGGAGGGAYRTFSNQNGGNGANGRVQITVVVAPTSTTTGVNCGAGTPSLIYGASINCVATVTSSGGTPTGTISWTTSGAGSFVTSPCTLVSGSCSVSYSPSSVGTGSHSIIATYSGSASFTTSNGNQAVTVTPKALTMGGLSVPASKVYDGTTSGVVGGTAALAASETFGTGTTIDGKPYTGDIVSVTGTALGTYNFKDVLTATTVTFSGLSLSGAQAGNYTLTIQAPASATITAKALTMSGLSVTPKVYNGTTSAVVSGVPALAASETAGTGTTIDGKPYTGDIVSITGTALGTFDFKDVATATTVTFSGLSLTGGQAGNYTLTIQSPASATITAKALTATGLSAPASKLYDGTTSTSTIGSPALLSSEAAGSGTTSDGKPYTGDTVSIIGSAVGTYNSRNVSIATTVTFSGLSLTGTHAGNYTLTSPTTPATISARPITVTAITNAKLYDGTASAAAIPTNSGVVSGDTAAFVEAYNNKNAGFNNKTLIPSGIVTDGNSGNNYSYTFNNFTTGTITAYPIIVTALTNTKVYDGTTTAAAIPTNTGVLAGDTASFIESYSDKNVGSGNKTLVPSGIVSDGNGGNNYSYTLNNFTTGTITGKPITVTAVTNTKVYDGTTFAAALPTNSGLGTGDTANFIETYLDPNIGSGNKVLVPTGLVTDGNSGSNYIYTYNTFTTGTITPKPITVTANAGQVKTVGTADPVFTFTSSDVTVIFTGALDRAPGELVGLYAIGQGTLSAGSNYTISFVSNNFQINTKLTPTLTASGGPFPYDGASHAASVIGSVPGVVSNVKYNGSATAPINAGTYTVTANFVPTDTATYNSLADAAAGSIVINKKAASVTALDNGKTVGASDPALTTTNSGFIAGDLGLGKITFSATRAAGEAINTYVITPATDDAFTGLLGNYTVTLNNGTFTISNKAAQATLTAVATPSTVVYGSTSTLSTSGGSGTGAVTFDKGSSTGCSIFGSTLSVTDPNGTCAVTATKAADATYNSATSAVLPVTLTKATLTVTANNQTILAGSADPAFTFVYGGFVNGETASVLTTAPTCGVSVAHVLPGSYDIVCSGGVASNYTFSYVKGKLTVDPINTTPIFTDVPFSYWANSYIERLYNAGITGGCATTPSLMYCPDSTVTRAQMAVFLLKGIHGSSYIAPAIGSSTGFTDVPVGYWAAAWIKQLAAEGITGGCGTGIYCPDATVTRAQMAIFLLKAEHGSSYAPSAAIGTFTDVPVSYWAASWIERLAVEGITSGCGTGTYCPDAGVTRAQMAVFLVKTFGLP